MLGRDRDEEKEEETEADGETGSSEAKRAREMRNGEQDGALGRDGGTCLGLRRGPNPVQPSRSLIQAAEPHSGSSGTRRGCLDDPKQRGDMMEPECS